MSHIRQELMHRAMQQQERIDIVEANMPRHLPSHPSVPPESRNTTDVSSADTEQNTTSKERSPATVRKTKRREGQEIPKIQYITVADLREAPQYIKGRLTLEKVNDGVDALNKIVEAKYGLLRRPMRELTTDDLNLVQGYHELNLIEDVENTTFFSSYDIRTSPPLRPESTAKSILSILRHYKHIREVRGPKAVRIYIVLSS